MDQAPLVTLCGHLRVARNDRALLERLGESLSWAAAAEGDDALTMRGVTHNGHEEETLQDLVLRVQGEFRRRLEPLRVTSLQAGVILSLQRHADAKVKDTAAALAIQPPTLSDVVRLMIRKGLLTNRRAPADGRTVCLRLSRQGELLARKITACIRAANSPLTLTKEAR